LLISSSIIKLLSSVSSAGESIVDLFLIGNKELGIVVILNRWSGSVCFWKVFWL
jgi:hypothetical protein